MNNISIINNLKLGLEKCELERKYKEDEFKTEFETLCNEKENLVNQAYALQGSDDKKYLELSLELQEIETKIKELSKNHEKKLKGANVSIYLELRTYCNDMMSSYITTIEEIKKSMEEIKTQIIKSAEANKFDKVNELTLEASELLIKLEKVKLLLSEIEEFNDYLKKCATSEFENISKKILDGSFKFGELNTDSINVAEIIKSNNNDDSEKNQEQTTEQLENEEICKAKELVEKAKNSKEMSDLKEAYIAVNKLKDSDDKTNLMNELKMVKKVVLIKSAEELVETAEKTLNKEDILKATNAVESLVDSKEKDELLIRIAALKVNSVLYEFINLIEFLNKKVENEEFINKDDVVKLNSLYSVINPEDLKDYDDNYENIIKYYNAQTQTMEKEKYDEKTEEKFTSKDFAMEFFTIGLGKILSSKLANKVRLKNIKRNTKKLEKDKSLSEEDKKVITGKIEKSYANISDSSVIGGVRLFASRNRIINMKPTLYKSGLEEYEKMDFDSSRNKVTRILSKGIKRKLKDKALYKNEEMMKNILDQYTEVLCICDDYEKSYCDALTALDDFKDYLDETTYNAYEELFYIIANYRDFSDGEIYELSGTSIEDIKKYYDSDEYKKSNVRTHYIK